MRARGAIRWIRRDSPLRRLELLWGRVQPAYDTMLRRVSGGDARFVVNGDELRLLYQYGARYEANGYEARIHEELTRVLRPQDVFLDVGAHVGFFTLAAAIRGATVIAFEAAPQTASVLRRHVDLNGMGDRVTVVEAVVSDREGRSTFYVNEDTMAAAVSRKSVDELSAQRLDAPAQEIEQPSVTLDGYCRSKGLIPDLVKIDVEGAELAVLRGAGSVLESDAKVLCEIHPLQLEAAGGSELALLDLVASSGRDLVQVDERNPEGIYHAWLRPA